MLRPLGRRQVARAAVPFLACAVPKRATATLKRAARVRAARIDGIYRAVARQNIPAGELVLLINGTLVDRPSRWTIQIGARRHITARDLPLKEMLRRYPWRFTNHSCDPNSCVVGRRLVALRDIRAGEEISFNYNTTEYELAEPFSCHCGSPRCAGTIRGFRYLTQAERESLLPQLAPHLRRRR